MKMLKRSAICLAVITAMGASNAAFANETSSSIRGKISGPMGGDAAGVKITVIHEPSGTATEYVTNESGAFLAKGLRVGGPYKIIVDSDVHRDTTLNNIFLTLGTPYRLREQLEEVAMETIQVTGARYTQEAGGANSVFGADVIGNTPSFNNDIKDIARINPLVTINGASEMTIAGNNPRTNSLTVDGIGQNDDFGLEHKGYPSQQPPISLNAIEQISVDFAPFTAKKGNFGGGSINAVTKSGTNEFKFSGYAETSTPDMAGDVETIDRVFAEDDRGRMRPVLDENGHRTFETRKIKPIETQTSFGFNLGGALIEDELFYFVDYSSWSKKMDMDYGFAGSDATHRYDTTEEKYQEFLSILDNTYGMTDSLGGDPEDTNETLLVKLDWNINDDHRLAFTYQWQDDQDERKFGTGGSTVSLASSRYTYITKFNNFSTKLYSDWNDDFSTEIGISHKDVSNESATNSDIGSVIVEEYYRGPSYAFGRDEFRHANVSENQNTTISLDATYLLGDHEIKFGAKYESLSLYNLFAANSLGSWEFDNFGGFADREVGNFRGTYDFSYQNAYTNDINDTAYDVTRNQFAMYVEDTFYLTDDLELTAGVRYERLSADDTPTLNTAFQETYGHTNQENLDGLDIFLPRVGFQWFATEDLTVRGGVGRFQGGIPNVWYNNPFQKDGITLVAAPSSVINDYYGDSDSSPAQPADITQVPQEIQDSLVQGAGSTNYTDPNFELPSSWRAQLGFDYTVDLGMLGDDFKFSAEANIEKKENEAIWVNTALEQAGVAADGERIIYGSRYDGLLDENFDIMMTNADDDGRSVILSTALAKKWDSGISMMMSYTNQDITENHVGSSSRAQSNYKYNIIKSRNINTAERGHYEIEHSFKLNLGYSTELLAGYETRFDMFFERRSGRPFSWVMGMYKDRDLGDTRDFYKNSAYLAYIPTGADDPNVNWAESDLSWEELSVLMNQAGITANGEIIDRNTGTQPWVTKMDISIKQEIPGFAKGHKGQVYFMIDNFANLLNSDWGIEKRLTHPNQALYDFGGLDDQGRYILDPRFEGADVRNYNNIVAASSTWQLKVGVNYRF